MTWVYIRSEPSLYTVGHYAPDGTWHTDSDHGDAEDAAARVHYLNGGTAETTREFQGLLARVEQLEAIAGVPR